LSIPFYLGALAALDASGRVTALSGAVLPGGMALGQGLAAALVSHEDIAKVAILGAPAMLVALALIAAAARVRSHQPVPYPASSK
jgi:hypothetical protein